MINLLQSSSNNDTITMWRSIDLIKLYVFGNVLKICFLSLPISYSNMTVTHTHVPFVNKRNQLFLNNDQCGSTTQCHSCVFCISILLNFDKIQSNFSLCLNSFHLLPRKQNLEKCSIRSNKIFHNFHLSESSFVPGFGQVG